MAGKQRLLTLVILAPVLVGLGLFARSCGLLPWQWPSAAPASAARAMPMSVLGLVGLFQRECLDQADADWVRRQTPIRRAYCETYLGNPDHGDDEKCLDRVVPVYWSVPTSNRSTVNVDMAWDSGLRLTTPPPAGPLDCDVEVYQDLGLDRPGAISKLRFAGRSLIGPISLAGAPGDTPLLWRAAEPGPGAPVVILERVANDGPSSAFWRLEFHAHCPPGWANYCGSNDQTELIFSP